MSILQNVVRAIQSSGILKHGRTINEHVVPEYFTKQLWSQQRSNPSKDRAALEVLDENFKNVEAFGGYISALKAPQFVRQQVRNKYDKEAAVNFSRALQKIKQSSKSQAFLFELTNHEVKEFIRQLVLVTPKNIGISSQDVSRTFPLLVFGSVPPIPDFDNDPDRLERYIGLLTHTAFHSQSPSKNSDVIVERILRELMHPLNKATINLRTTTMFNDMIQYYARRNDFASCREFYGQMKIEQKCPNTKTYNLLLRNLAMKIPRVKKQLGFKEATFYLKDMKKNQVFSDVVTWNTCYQLLLDDISRGLFIEKMIENDVPVSTPFLANLFKSDEYTAEQLLTFLTEHNIPLCPRLLKVCNEKLIKEEKYLAVWECLKHLHEKGIKIGVQAYNMLLLPLAEKGRLDLVLIIFYRMRYVFRINPSLFSYRIIFKVLAWYRKNEHFDLIYNWMKLEMLKHTNGVLIRDSWFIKCDSISKANAVAISQNELEGFSLLLRSVSQSEWHIGTKYWHTYQFKMFKSRVGVRHATINWATWCDTATEA
ncbi:HGL007Wp [Eremothecium sinecaudum]|uniref:HGL007Wp n=1 Tax=Eremothecium sinecaudum TaxID=45286 RepID=A0A109V0C0_9SACH|nr:HGL007Wp [Eremothecium sinecaudum]AMD22333.1 HGL007Wp [Eremothecium sinecaudum]